MGYSIKENLELHEKSFGELEKVVLEVVVPSAL